MYRTGALQPALIPPRGSRGHHGPPTTPKASSPGLSAGCGTGRRSPPP